MKRRAPAPGPRLPEDLWRRAALLGLSFTLLCTCGAGAGDILRGGAPAGQRGAPTAFGANPAVTNQVRKNAQDSLARTTQAVQSVKAMQVAARAAALAGPNHLGPDPNRPGQLLPNVPNGLAPGGLQVAPGVPANLAAPQLGENAALWTGANLPTQTAASGRTVVTVKQNVAQAVLNWKTLNVGKETTLKFDQSAGGANKSQWIAFNKISDPSGSPTQILGRIEGDGQAYVINQNGILFGGSSQVNLRSFTASSLPINDNLIKQGLLNNRDAQFLFSALEVPGGSDGTPTFTPPPALTPDGRRGDVVVKAGAELSSPGTGDGNGGRVMLVGANVRNEGSIATPDGQAILAAGLQVGVTAHASADPSLRGLDVWVGAVGDYAGTVTNSGLIATPTGSTWMAGRAVNQLGVIDSTTNVALNGRIDLRASYGAVGNPNFNVTNTPTFVEQLTGVVTLGEKSVTRILPDYASDRVVPGTSLPEASQINIEGRAIHFQKEAVILAPNGQAALRAGGWAFRDQNGDGTALDSNGLDEPGLASQFQDGQQRFLFQGGQIYLETSVLLNVAGTPDVAVPLAHSILPVEFRGSELADSPLQRGGVLRAIPLTVDLRRTGVNNGRYWVGTPLGDVSGLAGLIERNVAQLTAAGGSISMQAGGSIVVRKGATIDVSGGYFQHEGGMVKTTRLIRDGRLVDIHNALPGQVYSGVYTGTFTVNHPKYGISETYTVPWMTGAHYEPGYIQGAAGGSLTLRAPSMALDGTLLGQTIAGPRERALPPAGSQLSLTFQADKIYTPNLPNLQVIAFSPTPPTVVLTREDAQSDPGPFKIGGDGLPVALAAERIKTVKLSPALLDEQGFGHLSVVNTDGDVQVPAGTEVAAPAGGSVALSGKNIVIRGGVLAPGGTLRFRAYNQSPAAIEEFQIFQSTIEADPLPAAGQGLFTLGEGARLSTAGLIVDDRRESSAPQSQLLVLDGGSIRIEAFSAALAGGSTIDVSGGVAVSARGAVSFGKGGSASILTGRDLSLGSITGGTLQLGSTLLGYSGSTGGALALRAMLIQVGGSTASPQVLALQPDFFRQGGFAKYTLTGIGAPAPTPAGTDGPQNYLPAVLIAPGTVIEPVAENWLAVPHVPGTGQLALRPILRPAALRTPASLTLAATGADDDFTLDVLEARGDIVVGAGARVQTDPAGILSLSGDTVSVFGALIAPGGKIALKGRASFALPPVVEDITSQALPTVHLGPQALLSVAGVTVLQPDAFGRRIGTVQDGGVITAYGNIVAQAGAVLDASGTSALLDVHPSVLGGVASPLVPADSGLTAPLWRLRSSPVGVDSSGGLIELEGAQLLLSDATLRGGAGGPTATGGTLSIHSGRFYARSNGALNGLVRSSDITLVVGQSGNVIPKGSAIGIGQPILTAPNTPLAGLGYFSIDRFQEGGFDALELGAKFVTSPGSPLSGGGNLRFAGNTTINARSTLRLAAGGVIEAEGAVNLRAAYIAVGQPFRPPLHPDDPALPIFQQSVPGSGVQNFGFAPTAGTGRLDLQAGLIDIGNLSLQTISEAAFFSTGDIRGNGTLAVRGSLTLRAAQIYPTTLATFNVFAYDPAGGQGSISIQGAGPATSPLSIGGNLGFFASTITQGGVLRAPLGTITIGWDGLTDFDPSDADIDPPTDPVSRNTLAIPVAGEVRLTAGSVTSVAAVDGRTGADLRLPFGLSPDGFTWIDPRGVNITTGGVPEKRVFLAGVSVVTDAGSTVDLRGGGDLSAYRWIPGPGGSIDRLGTASGVWISGTSYASGDLVTFGGQTWSARVGSQGKQPTPGDFWSRVDESYAVIPGFAPGFTPENSFNTGIEATLLQGDPGYVFTPNAAADRVFASLAATERARPTSKIGEQVYLEASPGLKAGVYTLLPRRYALTPGAFVVTPQTGEPLGTFTLPGDFSFVSGYRLNAFQDAAQHSTLRSRFEVSPPKVTQARTEFVEYAGNAFFADAAVRLEIARPQRLPVDAGYLALQGNVTLRPGGAVLAGHPARGRGAMVDLSSSGDILITGGSGTVPGGATAVLAAATLNSWQVESLLIGGLRRRGADSTTVDVRTNSVVLDDPGGAFSAPEIILASRSALTVTGGSAISSSGALSAAADTLAITGNGTLLRVSGDPQAALVRSSVTASATPLLTVGAGARIGGAGVVLDSTSGTAIDPAATLTARGLQLGSGQISIVLSPPAGGLGGSVVDPHLVLAGRLLADVQQAETLTLSSYRTIDVYGAGTFGSPTLATLTLSSSGLRGFEQGTGTAAFAADSITLGNPSNVAALAAPATVSGTLQMDARTVRLGANTFATGGYADVQINATGGLLGEGAGEFTTPGSLTISAPVVTGARGSVHAVTAGGALVLAQTAGTVAVAGGLGASFAFQGTSVAASSAILLPSGQISLRATAGALSVGGNLDASGTMQQFYDLTRYSDAGRVFLTADLGEVALLTGSRVSVASAGLGKAGTVGISAFNGTFNNAGTLLGSAAAAADSGSFLLDVRSAGDYASLNDPLQTGGFFNARNFRVRTGAVTISGLTAVRDFTFSADAGPLDVTGTIDASGPTGGRIVLVSGGSLALENGARLTVHAADFSAAGKGGSIRLEAGAAVNGTANPTALLDLKTGSVIDLGVDDFVAGAVTEPAASAFWGRFQGKLHLRAPRLGDDVRVAALAGDIGGASSVLVEGFRVYDQTGNPALDTSVLNAVHADATNYLNAGYAAMETRLLAPNAVLGSVLVIAPGVEIINRTGDLILGTDADDYTNDWNLAALRYGPKNAAGVLTLRAAGDLHFKNALSDGFAGDFSPNDFGEVPPPGQELWLRPLMDMNSALPVNSQSWSYRLVAGADLSATDFQRLKPLETLASGEGSVLVGKFYPGDLVSGNFATTASAIENRYQVVRTGAGDIDIAAGRDVQLRNQFATVYTAGVRLPYQNPVFAEYDVRFMSIFAPNDFATPLVELSTSHPDQGGLGAFQQAYPAQYSMAGGDLTIAAQADIGRFTFFEGKIQTDSSRQLPNNWLYRRGFVDPGTGSFGEGGPGVVSDRSASTTWWVDFSNFFQGFGALGGGDVTLLSGRNIINADAVTPTNARMPGRNDATGTNLAPDASRLVELGGGDVTVRAANNLDGGIYYVERGQGTLTAGGTITTNSSRSPSLGKLGSISGSLADIVQSTSPAVFDPLTWLPTTLFVGKSHFDVTASGDVLLGPATNPFFLPQGINNKFWYKTYFNTYSADAGVTVASFGGSVTHRLAVTLPGSGSATPVLQAWLGNQNLLTTENASFYEPWIRLAEGDVANFSLINTVGAPSLRSTAFAGNVNLAGALSLFPSVGGDLELAASGGIIGLQPTGKTRLQFGSRSLPVTAWTTASVNLSDADPASLPGVVTPLAYQALVGKSENALRQTLTNPFANIAPSFLETGSFSGLAGSAETKRALHAPGPLHAADADPVRLYAVGGDITGITLFAPKTTRAVAANDLGDVAFYIQNTDPENISLVSAGRDIIPFNENGSLRTIASDLRRGNVVVESPIARVDATVLGTISASLAGDLQISGPGVLEVFAGRNLDLGTGANLTDGTGVGISSIGNLRNPALPLTGADIIAFAGLTSASGNGPALGLSQSTLDLTTFLVSPAGAASPYLEKLGVTGSLAALTDEQKAIVALENFFRTLRDTGRNFATVGNYAAGEAAVAQLFGSTTAQGEFFTRARDIRTNSGGSISILNPGGGLTMASDIFGNPLTPPGIVTEAGGAVSVFVDQDLDIGQARIFTLRGGDLLIWSTAGDIAAGNAPKTVVTAPPTRVLIESNTATVQTDLGGLATGGGIGVLASIAGVPAGDVDLIAPQGVVDAGDAGIRVTGNLNIAATAVLNSSNIQAGGTTSGVPAAPTVAAPNIGALTQANNTGAQGASATQDLAKKQAQQPPPTAEAPSMITVEVLGYGGGEGEETN